MDEAQQAQIVDLLRDANLALGELGGRLPKNEDVKASGAFNRAVGAVQAALSILDS
jgi:hypothetical protein